MESVLPHKSYSLDEFARLNDIALTTVRGEIKSGRLVARKIGRRTIITFEDANDWRDRLPKVQPRVRVASIESMTDVASAEPASEAKAEVGGL
jgi:hypothetical protein